MSDSEEMKALAERCRVAAEAYERVLNMDGGQPQAMAAGLWASLHGHLFAKVAPALKVLATPTETRP